MAHEHRFHADGAVRFELPTLRAISQQWANSRTVAAAEAIDATLVEALSDSDADQLTGGAGADLFFIGVGDKITDYQSGYPKTNEDGDVVMTIWEAPVTSFSPPLDVHDPSTGETTTLTTTSLPSAATKQRLSARWNLQLGAARRVH